MCRPFEKRTSVLLFLREGAYTHLFPFYFSLRQVPGYRVVAPFYWHFWSTESRTKIVAPFYWRFENYIARRTVTVVGPVSWTRQPDASSFAVWPLLYKSSKFGWAAPLLGSFTIGDPDRGQAFGAKAFLYWWKTSPERSWGVGFPLVYHWRNGDDRNLLALPFVYRNTHRTGGLTISPFGYASRDGEARRGAVAWLYWFGSKGKSRHDVFFPFVWSFRSPGSSTTVVAPFVVHARRGESTFSMGFPLYFGGSNGAAGSSWKLLLPFFFQRRSDHGRRHTFIIALGGYRRDDDAASRTLLLLVPPIFHRRDPAREIDIYALLVGRVHDKVTDTTTSWAGPVARRTDPEGSSTIVFPLFGHFRDAATGATAHGLLPFYTRRTTPRETSTSILLFYKRTFKDPSKGGLNDGWSGGLFPVLFVGRRADRTHAVLFPLVWHFSDSKSQTTVGGPFYLRKDRQGYDAGFLPLVYAGERGGEGYKVVFPLFWRFTSAKEASATTVFGPLFVHRGRDEWSAGLAPLVFAGGGKHGSHFALAPIFWRFRDEAADKTTTVALNVLHRRHGQETTFALFPLLHFRRGTRPGGTHETSFTLFPLAHYRRDARSTVFASPVAAWTRSPGRQAGFAGPYFWYRSATLAAKGIFPLHFDITTLATGERTRMFGPWFSIDAPTHRSRLLFPFYGRYQDANETNTYVFPTYVRSRQSNGYALDAFLPLFWRSRSPSHSTTVVGTWFRKTAPDRSSTGVLPVYFYTKNDERSVFVSLPLIYRRADFKAGTTRLLAGPYYRATRPSGHTTAAIVWWSGREDAKSHKVLFPVYWSFSDSKAKSSSTLLGNVYWSRHDTRRSFGFLPILWISRDQRAGAGSTGIFPFFYTRYAPDQRTFLTLLFGWHRRPDRNWTYVLNFYRRDSVESTFTTVWPLYFRHVDKASETRTTVLLPVYFSRANPEGSLTAAALLFWRRRDVASSTTLALPLVFDFHTFHESRTTVVFPFMVRHRRHQEDSTSLVAGPLLPLIWRFSSPGRATTVGFPLYWDFVRGSDRTTVIFPFWWHYRRPTSDSKWVLLFNYKKGLGPDAGTYRYQLFPFFQVAAKRPGDFLWEFLTGLFGYERIGRNRYAKVFFFSIPLEPAPAAATSWYSAPRRSSRRVPTVTGIDTNTVW